MPQNLRFTAGLEHWSLRGSFLHDPGGGCWQDFTCGTEPGPDAASASGYLRAQVPDPSGFADLRQAILADAYRGRRVRLSADLKTVDATGKAGLYLRVIDPARSRPPEVREQLSLQGSTVWTRRHIEAEVPADSVYVLFGITLTGTACGTESEVLSLFTWGFAFGRLSGFGLSLSTAFMVSALGFGEVVTALLLG